YTKSVFGKTQTYCTPWADAVPAVCSTGAAPEAPPRVDRRPRRCYTAVAVSREWHGCGPRRRIMAGRPTVLNLDFGTPAGPAQQAVPRLSQRHGTTAAGKVRTGPSHPGSGGLGGVRLCPGGAYSGADFIFCGHLYVPHSL